MADWRTTIRQLAVSKGIGAASKQVGQRIGKRAKQIDPDAKIVVENRTITVNGMPRAGAVVVNRATSSARHEFDDDNGIPLRPMGRAATEARR